MEGREKDLIWIFKTPVEERGKTGTHAKSKDTR